MNKNGILIIEDDREMCEEFAEILRLEGYEVDQANDGIEGKKLVDRGDYEVVLLDLKLPGISGSELLKYIKKNRLARVIVITGKPLTSELHEILEPEDHQDMEAVELADGFAEKPFNIEEVLSAIRELTAYRGNPVSSGEPDIKEPETDA
ncbi:MAG: response regulator [Candidatus Krumholzibacteriales bacterium]